MASEGPFPTDSEYTGDTLLIFTAVFIPVILVCVALRYLARYLIKGKWGLDDILIFGSLMLQLGMAGIAISSVKNAGVGHHQDYLEVTSPNTLTTWSKHLVAIEYVYLFGVNIPKLAILALYHRLFPVRMMKIAIYTLMAMLVGLTISTVVAASVACIPFAANWNPMLPGSKCINKEALFIWSSMPNMITDLMILALPIKTVWELQTTIRMRIALTISFAIGSFGLVTSIIRFTTFFKNNSFTDSTWNAVDLIIWTQIEADVYLISACVMTWRPLLERIGRNTVVAKTLTRKTASNSVDGSPGSIMMGNRSAKGFHQLGDNNRYGPHSGIQVTTSVQVRNHDPEEGSNF